VLHLLGIDTIWVLDLRRDKVQSSSPPTPLPTARQPQLPYDLSSLEAVNLYKSVYKLFAVYGSWIGFGWLYFRLITAGDGEAMDIYKVLPALTGIGIVVGLVCPFNIMMKRERMRFLRCVCIVLWSILFLSVLAGLYGGVFRLLLQNQSIFQMSYWQMYLLHLPKSLRTSGSPYAWYFPRGRYCAQRQ
jgi:hypothetical protein